MPRLIDDLRAKGARLAKPHFVPPDKEKDWAQMAQELSVLLARPDLPVLLIDNVADYYYSSDQEYWDLRDDFPNLAPPYPAFWCESKLATKIHSKQCGDTDMSAFISNSRIGMLIHGLARDQFKGQDIPDNVKWVLWCELFIDYHQRDCTATGPHGSMMLAVDAEGVLVDRPWIQSLSDPRDNDLIRHYITFLHPAFLAMSFLHCKNVTIIDNQVPKPLAKKYQARTGVRPTVYKTLVIEPLKQVLRTQGRSGAVGLQKALHICRGHFRDYREGRGLFGKYHQLVWTPSIVRGTKGEKAPPREIEVKL